MATRNVKDAFIPASSFQGLMPGYVFRSGPNGLGYYRPRAGKDMFKPSLSFQGRMSGYEFRLGSNGLGYYLSTGWTNLHWRGCLHFNYNSPSLGNFRISAPQNAQAGDTISLPLPKLLAPINKRYDT